MIKNQQKKYEIESLKELAINFFTVYTGCMHK